MSTALTQDNDARTLLFVLPREIVKKIHRLPHKIIARCLTPDIDGIVLMPDSPDPDKEFLGIRLERTLKRRVKRAAAEKKLSMTDWVRMILIEKTSHVTLTSFDYEEIARETRAAEEALQKTIDERFGKPARTAS